MTHPHFFGYGSLVNQDTHIYPNARHATLQDWRRAWVRTDARDVVFLTAVPAPGHRIDGLIAAVPDADWAALDQRESGYERISSHGNVTHSGDPVAQIAHYAVAPSNMRTDGQHVILLSYLDVVVQGYLREFGRDGVHAFFDTTDGWDTPILNDRPAPKYPRAQVLTATETQLVDHHLSRLSARVQ
jgi:hypothetical protein